MDTTQGDPGAKKIPSKSGSPRKRNDNQTTNFPRCSRRSQSEIKIKRRGLIGGPKPGRTGFIKKLTAKNIGKYFSRTRLWGVEKRPERENAAKR